MAFLSAPEVPWLYSGVTKTKASNKSIFADLRYLHWFCCDFCLCRISSWKYLAIVEKHFLLLSCPLYLLTVGSFTASATSDYELSEQATHHAIEWFFATTFKGIGTSPYRGTAVRLCSAGL